MSLNKKRRASTETLALTAILTALVIVLQLLGSFIRFGPFSISLVLLPIVIGAAKCGTKAGAWLGLVFGLVVLISGDAALFLAVNVPGTILTVLLKGALSGLCAGLVYKLLEKHNKYVAVMVAALVCPIVNTGIFFLGCLAFFMEIVGEDATAFFVSLITTNFLIEIAINIVLSPAVVRLLNLKKK